MSDPVFRRSVAALEDARPRETPLEKTGRMHDGDNRRTLKQRARFTSYYSTWIEDSELPLAELLQKQPRAILAAAVYLLDMAGVPEDRLGEILDIVEANYKNTHGKRG